MADVIPTERQPKGDHNRRLSLGLDPDQFAAEAGVTTEELREYERTSPDHRFDADVAAKVGATLTRLEAVLPNSKTGRQEPEDGAVRQQVGAGATGPITDHATPDGPRYTGNADPLAGGSPKLSRDPGTISRQPHDLPGADGPLSAGANQDTFD